jgi:PA14 domain-containing protein
MKLLSSLRQSILVSIAGAVVACSGPAETDNQRMSGTLVKTIVHENAGGSHSEYYLSVDRKWTRLTVDDNAVDPRTINRRVQVVGRRSSDGLRITVERIELPQTEPGDSLGTVTEELSSSAPKGKVAVILVKDSRLPNGDPYSKQAVRDTLFDSATSTDKYFKEISYGAYGLSGDVFGWVSTDMSDCNSTDLWRQQAEAAAVQLGFVTDDYRHLIYLYERQGDTCFLANGTFGSPDGVGVIQSFYNRSGTFAHEIGHNLGLDHATLLACRDPHFEYVSFGSQCQDQVYNDPFDAMGYDGFYYHYNSYSKQLQGWLPEANVKQVTAAGSFTLVPQETAASALQSLLIPIPNSTDLFHVELRKRYGFDNETRFDGAVLVRRVSQYGLMQYTHLIDMTPDGEPSNASLAIGQTFRDELSGISIKLQSRTSANAVITVGFGEANCSDGVKNNSESDVDCGGLCYPCQEGMHCTAQKECNIGACSAGVCVASQGGFTGQYFSGMNFEQLMFTETDPFIDFDWASFSPGSLPTDHFSVRWLASLQAPTSGNYTFRAATDDGVRLWVGDQLVIDRWHDAAVSEGQIELSAGQSYPIKMEYFEDGGDARARLTWAPPGELFDLISPALLQPVGCSLATAVDLGPRTTPISVASDACVKITQFPNWWQNTNGAVTLQSGTGSFPVPLTWQSDCGQSGSGSFGQAYQSLPIGSYTQSCPALIDLNGNGSPVSLSWW